MVGVHHPGTNMQNSFAFLFSKSVEGSGLGGGLDCFLFPSATDMGPSGDGDTQSPVDSQTDSKESPGVNIRS